MGWDEAGVRLVDDTLYRDEQDDEKRRRGAVEVDAVADVEPLEESETNRCERSVSLVEGSILLPEVGFETRRSMPKRQDV